MPKGATRAKANNPSTKKGKSATHAEKDEIISGLRGKVKKLEGYNKALSRENTEQGNLIAKLRAELDKLKPPEEVKELSTIVPDDLVKVKIIKEGYKLQMDDVEGNPHTYITGDVFEVSARTLVYYPSGAIKPLSELDD